MNMSVFHKKLREQDKLSNDVYHYTDSYEKLNGILQRRQLKLIERTRAPKGVSKETVEYNDEVSYSLSKFIGKQSVWNKELKFPPANPELRNKKTFGECFHYYITGLRFFTASLSIRRDDPNLWKLNHFSGNQRFSIKISKEHFIPLDDMNLSSWNRFNPCNVVMKIGYDETELDQLFDIISKKLSHLEKKDARKYWNGIFNIFSTVTPLLPRFLHPYYQNEDEYRIYIQDIGHKEEEKIASEIIEIGNDHYPYVYSEIIELKHIKEILIWEPESNFENTKDKIKRTLKEIFGKEYAENVKVIRSSVWGV